MIRDYTIHLRVSVPPETDLYQLDEDVSNIVDASTARDAIQTGLDYCNSYEPPIGDRVLPDLVNLYVVSNTKPEGGID